MIFMTEYDKLGIRERYKELFESSLEFILVYSMDGHILDVNDYVLNKFGYTPDEVINKPFRDFINEEDLRQAFKSIREIRKIGRVSKPNVYRIKKKNGKFLFIEIFGIPLKENGKIYATIATGHDITELKEAQQKLKESEEMFRTIAEQSQIGIVILQDNLIKYSNQRFADISGYTIKEMMAWQPGEMFKIIHPDDRKTVIEQATKKQLGEGEVLNHYFFRGIRKDGELCWIENFSKTITYEAKPADLILIVDATEKKESEQKLIESEEKYKKAYEHENFYKDLFVHDTNNILQSMLSSLEICELKLKKLNLYDELKDLFNLMGEQINRGADLVKNVSKFSKLDEFERTLREVNIHEVLEDTINLVKNFMKAKKITISFEKFNEDIEIKADEFIIDVFENIIINSIRHNNNHIVEILIKTLINQNGELQIEFIDNGIGIHDSLKELIFERIYKENRTVSGIGLGLSLVKKILNFYDAKIWVENRIPEDYSKGTKFTLTFPIVNT